MPFQPGNSLGQSRRTVEAILRRVAYADPQKMRRACERVLESAADGETWTERMAAFEVLASRLDGKPRQSLDITSDGQPRELSLSDVVAAVLAARRTDAVDAQHV